MRQAMKIGLVVAALLALSACAGSKDGGRQEDDSAATSARPSSSSAPATKVASVEQYAGIVNSSMKDIRKAWDTYEDEFCALDSSSVPCKLTPMTLDTLVQTLVVKLQGAAKPGVPAYIGKPPAEIEKLVTDTINAAQVVDALINESGAPLAGMGGQMNELLSVFDRWEVYI